MRGVRDNTGDSRSVTKDHLQQSADDYAVCAYEARLTLGFWLVQSLVMVGGFLMLGYDRTTDPFGFPLGLPSWYLFGGILPAVIFPLLLWRMVRTRFRDLELYPPASPPSDS